jgi:transposase InsO family protein
MQSCAVLLTQLVGAPDFAVLDATAPAAPVVPTALAALEPTELDRLRRLEAHVAQIDTAAADQDTTPDPRYDHRVTTLEQRVAAKVVELAGSDMSIGRSQLFRLLAAYRAEGGVGLLSKPRRRALQGGDGLAGVDERVVAGLREVMGAQTPRSTVTRKVLFGRLRALLAAAPGEPVPVPSDRVLYRIAVELDRGGHVFGAATTRRTTANRPDRPFTAGVEMRPEQQVHIDTNTVDIMCRYADGVTRRAELTIAVDVATRSIGAGVVAPSTKAVDAVAVLARMVVPDALRPGWPESLLFAHSSLPYERLLSIDARFEQAAARPVILPDTIVCDRGSVYMAETFRRACRALGISVQPARPYTPTDKAIVERTFGSINTLFCQHVDGYVGGNVTMRGKDPAADAVFTVAQLQDLFDEWVVAVWQNRPHESLTHLWGQGAAVSPNDAYAAMIARSGYVPVPRQAADYVELLPAQWRQINEDGITYDNRVYDSAELNPYRRTGSGVQGRQGRWEIHHDPYDVTAVWVRNHHHGGWITAGWVHRGIVGQPFSAAIYEHVRRQATTARTPVGDDYIARRVAELLTQTGDSPLSDADRRAAAQHANRPARPRLSVVNDIPVGDAVVDDVAEPNADQTDDAAAAGTVPAEVDTGKRPTPAGFPVFDAASPDWRF